MPATRQNFTKLHEFYHYLQFLRGDEHQVQYSDLLVHRGYSEEQEPMEVEANFGASQMFCSDRRLITFVQKNYDFSQIAKQLRMSEKALENRFLNYLIFDKKISGYVAKQLVNDYKVSWSSEPIKLALTSDVIEY